MHPGRRRSTAPSAALLLCLLIDSSAQGAGRLATSAVWDDGQAEVAVYAGRGERYGIPRDYNVVLIAVKEPFDLERAVKAAGVGPDVLKLNLLLTMPTGVYTYRQMLSLFFRRPGLVPIKLAFSSQEWCGTTFKEWRDRGEASLLETHSYFEGEGDRTFPLAPSANLVFEDSLPLVLRDDPSPRKVRLVSSQLAARAPEPEVVEAWIEADATPSRIATDRGQEDGLAMRVVRGARIDRLWFGVAPPHILLRWERADGHVLLLRTVRRLPYWKLNRPGDERALEEGEERP